jgi:hypothetical protein
MPNWVYHDLTITGAEDELKRFMKVCLAKTPEGPALNVYELMPSETIFWGCIRTGMLDTHVERGGEAIKLHFQTAWSSPWPIFKELAARFPKLTIEGRILEEAYGFGGNVHIRAGKAKFEDKSDEIRTRYDAICKELGHDIAGTGLDVLDPAYDDEPAP